MLKKVAPEGTSKELLDTIAGLEQSVRSYQETDRKRHGIHRKLKEKLKLAKRAVKQANQQAKEYRKDLAALTLDLDAARLILKNFATQLPRFGEAGGDAVHHGMWGRTPRRARMERRAWQPAMRLGVLHQHDPRPFCVPAPPPRRPPAAPPVFSIVTPSWQQGEYLEMTLKSVLDQGYPSLEYIVMDGGSTDGSREIIERYAPSLKYWQSEPDGGQSRAIKSGFAHATGDIMAWLNSDDLYLPGTLAYVADYFVRNPHVDAVYGHRALINGVGHEIGRWYLPPHDATMLLWSDYIPQETWFWRRNIYEKCGGIDASKRFAMDWDLLLRMQHAGAVFHRLPEFLGCFRVHEAQKSQAIIHDVGAEEGQALRQRELGPFFNCAELERRCTVFQLRALRTMRLWKLGIRSVRC